MSDTNGNGAGYDFKLVVVDMRDGNTTTEEIDAAIGEAHVVAYIERDGHLNVTAGGSPDNAEEGVLPPLYGKFFKALSEKETSAKLAAQHLEQRLARADRVEGEPALTKAARVWEGDLDFSHPYDPNG